MAKTEAKTTLAEPADRRTTDRAAELALQASVIEAVAEAARTELPALGGPLPEPEEEEA